MPGRYYWALCELPKQNLHWLQLIRQRRLHLIERLTEREQVDRSQEDEGVEGLCKKKNEELADKNHSVVIVGGEGWVEVEEGLWGITGTVKKYNEE